MNLEKYLQEIAKAENKTVQQVRKEMQASINEASKNRTPLFISVFGTEKIPTIEEFIKFTVSQYFKK